MDSNTCVAPPLARVIPLHRSWLLRLADALVDRLHPRPQPLKDADYAALADLDQHTLRDIGVPDWVQEERRRDALWQLERVRW